MAEPTEKHPEIRRIMKNLMGRDSEEAIHDDSCVKCGKPATEFTDEVSRREYRISGFCQACQDIAFAPPPDEEE